MRNFYRRIRQLKIINKLPGKLAINSVLSSFSRRERIVFFGLVVVLLLSTILILESINKSFMVEVPLRGGSTSLGIIGTPRFINPILANSLADESLTALIYSGLMRRSPDGTLIPDLAEKYEMSENGLIYTFTLKDNLYFQDEKIVTVDDVIFTISKIKDSIVKSSHKANWDGVSVEKVDEKTVRFTLKQPYASFLENTTLGIIERALWDNSPIELNTANTSPIGSGPYMINTVNKKSSWVNHILKISVYIFIQMKMTL